MILVVGGTGVLGRETIKQLLARGEAIRVMTRTPAKADDLKQAGVEVVQGDLIDPPSLGRACQGIERLLATAHSMLGKGKYDSKFVDDVGHRALIDTAKAAGVAHFVYISIQGASPDHPVDFFRTKYKIETYLKASGLSYSILRPPGFMEWQAHIFNGQSILNSGKTTILGAGTKERNLMAVRDVGRFAVMALTDQIARNSMVEIGGPQNFTNNQVAELYGKLIGITPKVSHMPPAAARVMSVVLLPFQPGLSRIMYMNSLPDDAFDERFDPTVMLQKYPMRLATLEEFIRERIAERRGA